MHVQVSFALAFDCFNARYCAERAVTRQHRTHRAQQVFTSEALIKRRACPAAMITGTQGLMLHSLVGFEPFKALEVESLHDCSRLVAVQKVFNTTMDKPPTKMSGKIAHSGLLISFFTPVSVRDLCKCERASVVVIKHVHAESQLAPLAFVALFTPMTMGVKSAATKHPTAAVCTSDHQHLVRCEQFNLHTMCSDDTPQCLQCSSWETRKSCATTTSAAWTPTPPASAAPTCTSKTWMRPPSSAATTVCSDLHALQTDPSCAHRHSVSNFGLLA